MARNRMIKPEFWTSEQIVECSPITRLLFIGLWNFCDDGGNHVANIRTLKMEVFPGDEIGLDAVQVHIDELIKNELLVEYVSEGKNYWHVTGWHHQRIEKPTYKHPKFEEQLATSRRAVGESSTTPLAEEKRKEEKGNEANITNPKGLVVVNEADDTPAKPKKPDCPHQAIIDLYHEVLPMCPQVRNWTPARAAQLRARWNENPERQHLNYWRQFFEYVASCDFLVGKAGNTPFFADLEWIVKSANFTKIREGKYENRKVA